MKKIRLTLCAIIISLSVPVFALSTSQDVRKMIKDGDEASIAKLISDGTDFDALQKQDGKWGASILEVTVYYNQPKILKMLLDHQPKLAKGYGADALTTACASNKQFKTIIKILVDAGVDVNSKSKSGKTCLYSAALAADTGFFNYLLGLGASSKTTVVPEKVLGIDGPVTIENFVAIRLKRYQEMMQQMAKQTKHAP